MSKIQLHFELLCLWFKEQEEIYQDCVLVLDGPEDVINPWK